MWRVCELDLRAQLNVAGNSYSEANTALTPHACTLSLHHVHEGAPAQGGFVRSQTLKLVSIALAVAALGVVALTSIRIVSVEHEFEVNGLGDAATLSCSQLDALDGFFGGAPQSDCADDPGYLERQGRLDQLPLLRNVRIGAGVALLIAVGGFWYSRRPKSTRLVSQASLADRLQRLEELRSSESITEAEYQGQRRRILDEA